MNRSSFLPMSFLRPPLALILSLAAGAVGAQTACPTTEGYGPEGSASDYDDMATLPLPDALGRVAACETALIPAQIALVRARYSDDPTLRPVLRDVVSTWRVEAWDVAAQAYVALAVLGADPDYFVEEAERAVSEGSLEAARAAARIAAFFPDGQRQDRLRALEASSGVPLDLDTFDRFVGAAGGAVFDETGYQPEGLRGVPLNEIVGGLAAGLLSVGFSPTAVGDDGIAFPSAPGSDSFSPENVLLTRALRTVGAADPEGARVALESSDAWTNQIARLDDQIVETVRRMVTSALLPGESLTDPSPVPPADGSLLAESLPAAIVVDGNAQTRFQGMAFVVSGRPHSTTGSPVDGQPAVAIQATLPETVDAILGSLSDAQAERLGGGVTAGPLPVQPSAWADALARRADVVLSGRPSGDIGAPDAPVVAYAPDGVRLDGASRGWGVLVVDGALSLRGTSRWTGVVLVRGGTDLVAEVEAAGAPSVVGAVVLADGASLRVSGRVEILYSPDALRLARSAALSSQ